MDSLLVCLGVGLGVGLAVALLALLELWGMPHA